MVLMVMISLSFSMPLAAASPVSNGWQLTQLDRMIELMMNNRIEKK